MMGQYFTKGWFEAYPGEHQMQFNLPPTSVDATTDLTLQNETESSEITFVAEFNPGSPDPDQVANPSVVVRWNNRSDGIIAVDYEITPRQIVIPEGVKFDH